MAAKTPLSPFLSRARPLWSLPTVYAAVLRGEDSVAAAVALAELARDRLVPLRPEDAALVLIQRGEFSAVQELLEADDFAADLGSGAARSLRAAIERALRRKKLSLRQQIEERLAIVRRRAKNVGLRLAEDSISVDDGLLDRGPAAASAVAETAEAELEAAERDRREQLRQTARDRLAQSGGDRAEPELLGEWFRRLDALLERGRFNLAEQLIAEGPSATSSTTADLPAWPGGKLPRDITNKLLGNAATTPGFDRLFGVRSEDVPGRELVKAVAPLVTDDGVITDEQVDELVVAVQQALRVPRHRCGLGGVHVKGGGRWRRLAGWHAPGLELLGRDVQQRGLLAYFGPSPSPSEDALPHTALFEEYLEDESPGIEDPRTSGDPYLVFTRTLPRSRASAGRLTLSASTLLRCAGQPAEARARAIHREVGGQLLHSLGSLSNAPPGPWAIGREDTVRSLLAPDGAQLLVGPPGSGRSAVLQALVAQHRLEGGEVTELGANAGVAHEEEDGSGNDLESWLLGDRKEAPRLVRGPGRDSEAGQREAEDDFPDGSHLFVWDDLDDEVEPAELPLVLERIVEIERRYAGGVRVVASVSIESWWRCESNVHACMLAPLSTDQAGRGVEEHLATLGLRFSDPDDGSLLALRTANCPALMQIAVRALIEMRPDGRTLPRDLVEDATSPDRLTREAERVLLAPLEDWPGVMLVLLALFAEQEQRGSFREPIGLEEIADWMDYFGVEADDETLEEALDRLEALHVARSRGRRNRRWLLRTPTVGTLLLGLIDDVEDFGAKWRDRCWTDLDDVLLGLGAGSG